MILFIGTAGWSIPKGVAEEFVAAGSTLERYASRFRAVEINSSFYRPHRQSTWAKWASQVPDDFRFSVKVPKAITHERKLVGCDDLIASFCEDVAYLGTKHAVLLVQLPPKLAFDEEQAARFFTVMHSRTSATVVCEPRHASWLEADADILLEHFKIARVAADPPPVRNASSPGGWNGLSYWRLHGSPHMYRSPYGPDRLEKYISNIAQTSTDGADAWVMFDNTASSAAASDALMMQELAYEKDARDLRG